MDYDAVSLAADYRLRIEAARARLNQALLTEKSRPGTLPPWSDLVRDAIDALTLDEEFKQPHAQRSGTTQAAFYDQTLKIDKSPLTPQQSKIIACLASGMSRQEAADYLNLSVATIKSHLLRAKHATGLSPRQLVAKSIKKKWIKEI